MKTAKTGQVPYRALILATVALACLPLVTTTGCGNSGDRMITDNSKPKSLDEQIKIVQDDPNTPDQAKAGIIAAMRANAQKQGNVKPAK